MTSGGGDVETWLVGDVGATNVRFGLVSPERELLQTRTRAVADHLTIADAVTTFLGERGSLPMPRQGAIAIASAITGDQVAMTNHPWSFSISALKSQLGFHRLEEINDFTALALALPHLEPEHRLQVGDGTPVGDAPLGVLGPGTGLGVSGLIPTGAGWIPLAGEGGHATMAPATDRESAVLDRMRRHFDHVSAERVLSGPGLVNLYNTLSAIEGAPSCGYTAAEITDHAIHATDQRCVECVAMFCALLGTIAGNLALTLGARGGVYIAGGIVPRFGAHFPGARFRTRFEGKGRLSTYLVKIPTFVMLHPYPSFVGLAALLRGTSAIAD